GAGAVLLLLELRPLPEVSARAGVVAPVREGVVRAIECIKRICAERRAVVGGAAVLVDLPAAAVVADRGPALGAASVAEGHALDLDGRELEPGRYVVRVAGILGRAAGEAELTGGGRVVTGVANLPHQAVRCVVYEPPRERVAECLPVERGHEGPVDLAVEDDRAGVTCGEVG